MKTVKVIYGSKEIARKVYEALGMAFPSDEGLVGVTAQIIAGQPIAVTEIRNAVIEVETPDEDPQPEAPEAAPQPQTDAPATDAPATDPASDAPQG